MSALYLPALAVEVDEETETYSESDETIAEADVEAELDLVIVINSETGDEITVEPDGTPIITSESTSDSIVPQPFTPFGTGTVVDNANDGDGKEFYTITTDGGDIFYLIIDRQRNSQNVYFLNAVTAADLIALAEQNGKGSVVVESVATYSSQPEVVEQEPTEPLETEAPEPSTGNSTMIIVIVVVAAGVGGVAYYFKIVKGRKNAPGDYDDDYDDNDIEGLDEDDGYDYKGEPDDSSHIAESGDERDE